jgi:hypothetical protein
MMALNQDIVESVANLNFKALADQSVLTTNLMAQNAASHQNRINVLAEGALGNVMKNLTEFDQSEAAAISTMIDSRLAPHLSSLAAAIASIQQYVKTSQSTPPVTP